MVEPADVDGVLHGIAGKAEGDDLMDRPMEPVEADVREPGGGVGRSCRPKRFWE